nr:MAG: N-acetyltransferase [Actinomycetota bacterium]
MTIVSTITRRTHPEKLVIEPARGRDHLRAFTRLPRELHRGDPHWLPPLVPERRAIPGGVRHPVAASGEAELFLAIRDGRPVGRIAVVRHRRRTAFRGAHEGLFGMFDCIEDADVAGALIEAAARWLGERGCGTMIGPVGLLPGQESGLLVDGPAAPPVVLMPYHPPYYPGLLEACGMAKAKDLWTWSAGPEPTESIRRIARDTRRREGLTVRTIDPDDLAAESARLAEIRRGGPGWALSPTTDREFAYLLSGLRGLLPPGAALICESRGEPVAFALAIPDRTQELTGLAGRAARLGVPPGLLLAARSPAAGLRWRAAAFGVKEGFRGLGLEAVLVTELWRSARRHGCGSWEATWTLEDNHAMNRVMEVLGASRSRTYRLYRKAC